jgi:hypothetical protein
MAGPGDGNRLAWVETPKDTSRIKTRIDILLDSSQRYVKSMTTLDLQEASVGAVL